MSVERAMWLWARVLRPLCYALLLLAFVCQRWNVVPEVPLFELVIVGSLLAVAGEVTFAVIAKRHAGQD